MLPCISQKYRKPLISQWFIHFEGTKSAMISNCLQLIYDTVEKSFVNSARVEEIFDKVDAELKKIDRSGKLPAGVVLTGGGAKLNDIVEAAKKLLRLPAVVGTPQNVTSAIDKINDPTFATAVGLVLWGSQLAGQHRQGRIGSLLNFLPNLGGISSKTKKWFKKIMP